MMELSCRIDGDRIWPKKEQVCGASSNVFASWVESIDLPGEGGLRTAAPETIQSHRQFPPLRDVLEMMEQNTGEGWPPADDPEACTMALSEVQQTEIPSRVCADIWHWCDVGVRSSVQRCCSFLNSSSKRLSLTCLARVLQSQARVDLWVGSGGDLRL